MMSPLSVAHPQPGALAFDLVVFDEASQVGPVDALGACARPRRAVVVGDSASFRRRASSTADRRRRPRTTTSDERDARDRREHPGAVRRQGAPQRMLRWHYRSRHESLIAVSNREFYDDRLFVFPSPDDAARRGGLKFRHLPGRAYDRGRTRTNPVEAEAVAEAVAAHAREQLPSNRSAWRRFRLAQRAGDPERAGAAAPRGPVARGVLRRGGRRAVLRQEPGERAGGRARRDLHLASATAGRRRAPGDELRPAQRRGGERRLNVLITRAKLRCEVFRTSPADDIDLERAPVARRRGAEDLPDLCPDRPARLRRGDGRRSDSAFEEQVAGAAARRWATTSAPDRHRRLLRRPGRRRPGQAGPLRARHRVRRRAIPLVALGARPRPAAPAGAGRPRLDHPPHLERRLVISAPTRSWRRRALRSTPRSSSGASVTRALRLRPSPFRSGLPRTSRTRISTSSSPISATPRPRRNRSLLPMERRPEFRCRWVSSPISHPLAT